MTIVTTEKNDAINKNINPSKNEISTKFVLEIGENRIVNDV